MVGRRASCRFAAAAGFYLGYELLEQFEPSVPVGLEDDFPLGALLRVPAAILVNRADASASWWPSAANNWIGQSPSL